jgi:hypothetical protein
MSWVGNLDRMWDVRDLYRILVLKRKGYRPLWRPRHTWENNIKMDRQEMVCSV